VNVKIVDVSLSNQDNYNSSFAFQVGDTFVSSDGGTGIINFGGVQPPSREQIDLSPTTPPITTIPGDLRASPNTVFYDPNTGAALPSFGSQGNTEILQPGITTRGTGTTLPSFSLPTLFAYPSRFLSQLEVQVINGNAKILTDPTLVVQEGQTTAIKLTTEVISGDSITFSDTDGASRESRSTVKEDVGLQMAITVNRIDDNGFVTIQANPQVSAPASVIDRDGQITTLIQRRSVDSGQIRMRDGQTLILSGIIQDTDRTTVSKVPILGDIPILGALFRSTQRENERNEVIVIVTPNILDDSDSDTFGYGYTPSREARDILEQQGNFQYPGN
jgi:type IV pilus assembly protein PilQ